MPSWPAATSALREASITNTVVLSAHGAISGATCFSAPHRVPGATSNPSAASAATIRCTGRPSTCFSYASRARNPAVNRPFGAGLAAGGAQTVAGPR